MPGYTENSCRQVLHHFFLARHVMLMDTRMWGAREWREHMRMNVNGTLRWLNYSRRLCRVHFSSMPLPMLLHRLPWSGRQKCFSPVHLSDSTAQIVVARPTSLMLVASHGCFEMAAKRKPQDGSKLVKMAPYKHYVPLLAL